MFFQEGTSSGRRITMVPIATPSHSNGITIIVPVPVRCWVVLEPPNSA